MFCSFLNLSLRLHLQCGRAGALALPPVVRTCCVGRWCLVRAAIAHAQRVAGDAWFGFFLGVQKPKCIWCGGAYVLTFLLYKGKWLLPAARRLRIQ